MRTEKDGKFVKEEESAGTFTFKGEKVLEDGRKEYGIFTLSANRKLKAIQFRFLNGKGIANLGAYELDGDTLRICRSLESFFPAEFKTKGTKNYIEEFKRVTKGRSIRVFCEYPPNNVLHLPGPASRFSETSRSLQPARK